MENEKERVENVEEPENAADIVHVPEGAKDFVDIIGDENLDAFGNAGSNSLIGP
ncbi:hypothetical protein SK3146_00901 [Paenibacillus konkukensis]|uniref:Uncharacterized protein n=1 Tax=Paenibacillus konkukensis TaxID=2020716 RepID=A0ABY4RIU7_9BACL|nr:hypothetical protein [Paenibacillus konkukensis]UQZ81745.1 hypothetical protein SK3146_00901 [Paenibacillus konkukensis]